MAWLVTPYFVIVINLYSCHGEAIHDPNRGSETLRAGGHTHDIDASSTAQALHLINSNT